MNSPVFVDCTDVSKIETRAVPSGSVAFSFECRDTLTRKSRKVVIRLNAMAMKELVAAMHAAQAIVRAEVEVVQAKINALAPLANRNDFFVG